MKPFTKTKLLKPVNEEWDIEDPMWLDSNTLNFYIPTWFNVDEFVEGLDVNSIKNDDYVNIYLNYLAYNGEVQLFFTYVNESGYSEGYKDFEAEIELDEKSKKYFKKKIKREWQSFLTETMDYK